LCEWPFEHIYVHVGGEWGYYSTLLWATLKQTHKTHTKSAHQQPGWLK